jgi:hypothetical protein
LGHNKTKIWAKLGDLLGQEKLIFGKNETNYGTKQGSFWGRRSWNRVTTRQFLDKSMSFWVTGR